MILHVYVGQCWGRRKIHLVYVGNAGADGKYVTEMLTFKRLTENEKHERKIKRTNVHAVINKGGGHVTRSEAPDIGTVTGQPELKLSLATFVIHQWW